MGSRESGWPQAGVLEAWCPGRGGLLCTGLSADPRPAAVMSWGLHPAPGRPASACHSSQERGQEAQGVEWVPEFHQLRVLSVAGVC